MADPHGMPIWYELVTTDADTARPFYEAVIGWTIEAQAAGDMNYRMITAADGNNVAGLAGGFDAPPGWAFYIGVDDVDATAIAIVDAGGSLRMPPFDLPGVGRMAVAAYPQGIAFYIMRGDSDADSTAFDRTGMGKCNWNKLTTPDQSGAHAFYSAVFGWTYPDRMTMPGDMDDYVFVAAAGETIGATMTAPADAPTPPGWRFYFRSPDIDAAAATVRAHGGTVHMGPNEVPGGDRIIIAGDPAGLVFGVVGPGQAA